MGKLFCFFFAATSVFGSEKSEKLSEALGHLIGKNLKSLDIPIDIEALAKGLQEEAEGISSPLSEDECVQALTSLEEQSYAAKIKKNLEEAEAFLQQNKAKKGIAQIEEGKLQFEILKKGKGQAVQPYNSPLVRYKGSFLNGESFNSNADEELIALDEAIPGLSKGIVGMREGEIRKLYIHPELGYGKEERLHPNSLLIFEVEIVEADASTDAQAATDAPSFPRDVDAGLVQ